ncbi:MAG: DUF1329 domain-containing protein [Gammaproteobacteria bacterium]|nr:DUF1329 domain-containing protein [Gammaproteobacteria bacterium]NND59007.1 DUF1329 domain-containing protein [Gammaproteobacteria bacterium]
MLTTTLALLALGITPLANAAVSAEQAARLGNDLTPMGAEKAANADGTIPAWEGGIRSAAEAGFPDFKTGGHHPDPFSDDDIAFTINAQNMDQHADKLTEGHKALLKTYPDTYFINVYPTRRSAGYPDRIYEATKRNAASAELIEGGNGVTGATESVPFPIPSNGVEVIWNHILRYRGDGASRTIGQAPVTRNGDFTMVMLQDEFYPAYSLPGAKEEELDNVIVYFKQQVKAPPRLAGQILLVHETLNQALEHRKAWLYNPGQRRVRRAPNVAFDNPGTAADGLRTSDDLDLFNGSPERYNWELVGKREMYVPYNAYKLHSDELEYDDIIKPLHINQDHARYELHRVWVVDATLKDGIRHVYKRRTFYIDEDSWQILAEDIYDNRDQIWRVAEGHAINYYDVPTLWTTLDVYTDLQVGRYLALGLNNQQNKTYEFVDSLGRNDFSPSALRRAGTR